MVVELAVCRTDSQALDLKYHAHLFSAQRLNAVSRRPVSAQRSSVAGQWLLKTLLAEKCPNVPFPPQFCYGAQGKPAFAELNGWHFNISHSGVWAVCALCNAPVGADIQQSRRFHPTLAKKFSSSEQQALSALPEQERQRALTALWTLKEAYCKCTGDGLRTRLNATSFTLSPVTLDKKGYRPLLIPFDDQEYSLAVCVETSEAVQYRLLGISSPTP